MNKLLLTVSCLFALVACRSYADSTRPEDSAAPTAKPEVRYYVIADT